MEKKLNIILIIMEKPNMIVVLIIVYYFHLEFVMKIILYGV
jgi:hypothetical protein